MNICEQGKKNIKEEIWKIYFELPGKITKRDELKLGQDIASIDLGRIRDGKYSKRNCERATKASGEDTIKTEALGKLV